MVMLCPPNARTCPRLESVVSQFLVKGIKVKV
jgi:hypothetical protein